jgi:hypothetical protein
MSTDEVREIGVLVATATLRSVLEVVAGEAGEIREVYRCQTIGVGETAEATVEETLALAPAPVYSNVNVVAEIETHARQASSSAFFIDETTPGIPPRKVRSMLY